jgi:hypothetical protein
MRTFLTTTQDTTIYKRFPTLNTGLDEILEVGKLVGSIDGDVVYSRAAVRSLLDFNINSGSNYPTSSEYYLNLYIANTQNVNRYQTIEIYPITSTWIEGSGYRYQDVTNAEDGATWLQAQPAVSWSISGSDFSTSITSSYEFSQVPITDVRINVTDIVAPYVVGTGSFYGLLMKFPDADEANQKNKGNIKFFSGNTHTVFEPRLEIVWPTGSFETGSLKPIPNGNVTIIPRNLKEAYTQGEIDKVRLVVRDPYPDKNFDATQRFRNQYYLPSGSYYRITDEVSGIKLADFDVYSPIECDVTGSYIMLDTTGLTVDRYYKIELKVTSNSLVFFPEFNYTFTVDSDGR